jgi:HPt (histidine-containing phosphotransfer) domain-containing protein
MDDFLAKPVTEEKLAQVLDQAGLRCEIEAPGGEGGVGRDGGNAGDPAGVGLDENDAETARAGQAVPASPLQDGSDEGVDVGLLSTLAATLERGLVIALLDELCAEAEALPSALEAALSAGDGRQADRLLHSLKGAAATLGLSGAARLVQEVRGRASWTAAEAQEIRAALHAGSERAKAAVHLAGIESEAA